jgi:hypothetical protein
MNNLNGFFLFSFGQFAAGICALHQVIGLAADAGGGPCALLSYFSLGLGMRYSLPVLTHSGEWTLRAGQNRPDHPSNNGVLPPGRPRTRKPDIAGAL